MRRRTAAVAASLILALVAFIPGGALAAPPGGATRQIPSGGTTSIRPTAPGSDELQQPEIATWFR